MRPIPHQNSLFKPLNTFLKAGEFGLVDSWVLELVIRRHHLILWLGLTSLFVIYRGEPICLDQIAPTQLCLLRVTQRL